MRSGGDFCIATRGGTRLHLVHYGPGERHGVHSHTRSSLTLVLDGRVEERVGAAKEVGTALSVVVKPAGVPHADVFGDDGARTLLVKLSSADEALAVSSGATRRRRRDRDLRPSDRQDELRVELFGRGSVLAVRFPPDRGPASEVALMGMPFRRE